MANPELPPIAGAALSRRGLLVGAAAAALLAACSSDDDGTAASDPSSAGGSGGGEPATIDADGTYVIAQRFPQDVQEPGPVRLAISLAASSGALVQDGPDVLHAQVTDLDGAPIGDPISAVKRVTEPAPYYAFRTTLDEAGFYFLVVDGGPAEGAAFQVMEPGTVAVAGPGDELPAFDTPTTADGRGVDPLCTRQPDPCPFHDLTLTEALASGKPVVYLIGTPAFCSTGTCAPGLESLIESSDEYGDTFAYVHAEVYTDDTATVVTPAVEDAAVNYEPIVFVADEQGIVVERLDAVWDATELAEVLASVAG